VISVSRCAQRGGSHPGNRPMTQGAHHRAPPSSPLPPGPGCCSCPIAAIVAAPPPHPPYITLSPQTPPFSHIIPYAPPLSSRPLPPNPMPSSRRPRAAPPITTGRPLQSHQPRNLQHSRPSHADSPPGSPRPCRIRPAPNPGQTERNPRIRGKPFLTASNALADYSELPTSQTSRERIEGVSRSLPFSDLLALTSSHMFFSVMN